MSLSTRSANASLPADLPYRTSTFVIRCAGGERSFLRPADPSAVLDDLTDEQFDRDEQLPYWAELWPATEVAARFICGLPLHHDTRVCELGCGLGVLAAIAAERADTVVATDISLTACRFARANLMHRTATPGVVCADWRATPLRPVFDFVIGADVLYEERWVEPVLRCIDSLLTRTGTAYIADPCRRHWRTFQHAATDAGFEQRVALTGPANEGRTTVEVLQLRRRG